MLGSRIHRAGTVVLSTLLMLIGVGLLVQALGGHGGGLLTRLLLGVLFMAAGAGRLYVEARRKRQA
jgi:hypothetical protein